MYTRWFFILTLLFTGCAQAEEPTPVSSACVDPNENVVLEMGTSAAEFGVNLQAYLSAGGTLINLLGFLRENRLLPNSYVDYSGKWSAGLFVYDMTGDNKNEVIVNIHYPDPQYLSMFVLWIYKCENSTYQQVFETSYPGMSPVLDLGMYVKIVQDVNNDTLPEIVYDWTSCGATSCWGNVELLTWDSTTQTIHNILSAGFRLGPYELQDTDGDKTLEVIIYAGNGGSVGAGPLRERTMTYGWDGTEFILRSDIPTPPTFRFEAALDASVALQAGDLQTATILYQRTLSDPSLKAGFDDRSDAIVVTYALFGMLVTTTAQQGIEGASEAYTALQNAPPIPDDFNLYHTKFKESLWVEIGTVFYETMEKSNNLNEACDAVVDELNLRLEKELENPSAYSDYWGNFGYGNSSPTPEQVCPF